MYCDVTLQFDLNLRLLLRDRRWRTEGRVALQRLAPLKDLVESLGVPHTEVGLLIRRGEPVGFGYVPTYGEEIHVLAPEVPVDVTRPAPLRPSPLKEVRFLADLNVERLGRLLRLAGFDAAPSEKGSDRRLAFRAGLEGRVVLTRDRLLLMRNSVSWGRLIRSDRPWDQLAEVVRFFGLQAQLAPFTRCPVCNGLLEDVPAETVWEFLEPLTRRYYREFSRCSDCGRVYWAGSHHVRALERLEEIVRGSDPGPGFFDSD